MRVCLLGLTCFRYRMLVLDAKRCQTVCMELERGTFRLHFFLVTQTAARGQDSADYAAQRRPHFASVRRDKQVSITSREHTHA